MRITSYFNTTPQEIAARTRNIYIGISLGNKYFTREHVADYIRWAVANTKERVVVFLADSIHVINLEVLNEYNPTRAMNKAMRLGDEMAEMIQSIISELPQQDAEKITIARWNEVEQGPVFQERLAVIMDAWNNDPAFRDYIMNIFREFLQARGRTLPEERVEYGCQYLLRELPTFFGGTNFRGLDYTLHPYPGITALAVLTDAVQRGELFFEFGKKLHMTERIAMVEAYAE